jgi:hypothetical protein
MHSFEVFHNYEQSDWHIRDLPWDRLRPDLVQPRDRMLAQMGMLGESNAIAALHNFLNESPADYDFAAFATLWGYQELRHHCVYRTWLERIGEPIDTRPVEAMRPVYPAGRTHAATLATNLISELTVCHLYHRHAQDVEEPVLREILTLASRDESRHAREFLYFAHRRLRSNPEERASVLETLYVYVADPDRPLKHPVTVFKGKLPEWAGQATLDDAFDSFMQLKGDAIDRLRTKIFHAFSDLTGCRIDGPKSIRRALADI